MPYLRLEDANRKELVFDDDSGRDLNARITFTCPKTGHYRIIATMLPWTTALARPKRREKRYNDNCRIQRSAMKQRPVAVGLLLCEHVIVEEGTRNITPVNCFNQKLVGQFPATDVSFTVFALLTDGSGDMLLEVVVQRLVDKEVIAQPAIPGQSLSYAMVGGFGLPFRKAS